MKRIQYKYLQLGFALFAGLLLLLPQKISQAEVTPRGEPRQGQVLQASTTCDRNNSFNLSVDPQTATIGDTIRVTYSIKGECVGPSEIPEPEIPNFKAWISHGVCTSTSGSCGYDSRITSLQLARSGVVTIQTNSTNFSAGNKALSLVIQGKFSIKDGTITTERFGSAQYSLKAAANTGSASLKLSEQETTVEGLVSKQVVKTISSAFLQGGGPAATKIAYDCGNGASGSVPVGQNFVCKYPLQAGNFTIKANAVDANNNGIAGTNTPLPIKITGTETSQGNGGLTTVSGEQNDVLGWVGETVLGVVNKLLSAIVFLLNELLSFLFFFIVGPFIEAILAIRTYTDKFAGIIYPAWEIFRNLSNIIFILSIIATGLATVFRVGGWQAKDILVKLIIGAILINFSLVIAQSVLGIADTVQVQFLPPDTGAIRLLSNELIVKGSRDAVSGLFTTTPTAFGTFGQSVRVIANFVTAFIAFIAFVAIAIFLLLRIIFLWLLLMTSPLPYVAMVLPVTRSITTRWWSNFIKYAFMTPAMAFMLNLSALIASKNRDVVKTLAEGRYAQMSGNVENIMFVLGANAIVIVFLFVSLKVASMIGAESGGLIEKVSDKGWRAALAPAGLAATGAKAFGGYVNRKKTEYTTPWAEKGALGKLAFSVFNPKAIKEAYVERRDERDKQVTHVAQGAAGDIVKDVFREAGPSGVGEAYLHGVEEQKKKSPYLTENQKLGELENSVKSGQTDQIARMEVAGHIVSLADEKGMNAVLLSAKRLGFSQNYEANREGFIGFMNELKSKGLATETEASHLAARLSQSAYNNREYWYAEAFAINHHGHPQTIATDERGNITGRHEYEEVEERITEALEAAVEAASRRGGWDMDSDEAHKFRSEKRGEVEHEVVTKLSKTDKKLFEGFENWNSYQNGRKEALINFKKMPPQSRARDLHWSFHVNGGTGDFSPEGIAGIVEADSGDYRQGDQLQAKKRESMANALNTPEKQEQALGQIVKYIQDKTRDKLIAQGYSHEEAEAKLEEHEVEEKINEKAKKKLQAYKKFYIEGREYKKGYEEEDLGGQHLGNLDELVHVDEEIP